MKKIKIDSKTYDLKNCEYFKFNVIDNEKIGFSIKEFDKKEKNLLSAEMCLFKKDKGIITEDFDLSFIDTEEKKNIFLSVLCFELVNIIRSYSNNVNKVPIEKIGNDEELDLLKSLSLLIWTLKEEYFDDILNSKIGLYQEYIIEPNKKKIVKIENEKFILNDIFDLRFNIIDNSSIEIVTMENETLFNICICEIEEYAAINNIDLSFINNEEVLRKFLLSIGHLLTKALTQFLNNIPLPVEKVGNDEELDLIHYLFILVELIDKKQLEILSNFYNF